MSNDNHLNTLKDKLATAFNQLGEKVVNIGELRQKFEDLSHREFSWVERRLIEGHNPCRDFDLLRLRNHLATQEDGSLGFYSSQERIAGLAEDHTYFSGAALQGVFRDALDHGHIPAPFHKMQQRVLATALQAYAEVPNHLALLERGRLRPVRLNELG